MGSNPTTPTINLAKVTAAIFLSVTSRNHSLSFNITISEVDNDPTVIRSGSSTKGVLQMQNEDQQQAPQAQDAPPVRLTQMSTKAG